jgi:hypothetical protein
MRRSLFAVLAAAVVSVTLGSSLVARSQAAPRFEYTQLTPFTALVSHPQLGQVWSRVGYRACVATNDEWTCREFRVQDSADDGFRTALTTLGREGWELITPYHESADGTTRTMLFKRPLQ